MNTKIIFVYGLLFIIGCNNSNNKKSNKLIGEWEQTNSEFDKYPPVNVFLQGVKINLDSLDFFPII